MILRKTKIVCSLGPSTADDAVVEQLIKAGMNIARFNFSHGTHESHKNAMDSVKRCSARLGIPVALLLDTKGPEIRTSMVENDGKIHFSENDSVEVVVDGSECTQGADGKPTHISLSWKELPKKIRPGNKILIADGLIELSVVSVKGKTVFCTAQNSGEIGSRKNVNIIGVPIGLPIMSEQDKDDIAFGVAQDVDFIAASFVSFPEEIVEIRKYLDSLGSSAKIIAKIENEEGVNNIQSIIEEADGIMIARGDLGVQLPTERIPLVQKYIINECRKAGKPVITATQMLDSMIVHPRPTRAELTDVANALFDGTDATMLSGETANGKYPVQSVETMATITRTVEDSQEYISRMNEIDSSYAPGKRIEHIVAKNAYQLATDVKAIAIVTPTLSGSSARMVSQFRPEQTVIAVTPNKQVQRQLLLNWGVHPILTEFAEDSEQMIQNAIKKGLDAEIIHLNDRIVALAGIPLNNPVKANTIKVILVGNVITSGTASYNSAAKVSGRVVKVTEPEDALPYIKNANGGIILVCPRLTENFLPLLRLVNGVVCETGSDIPKNYLSAVNHDFVWILNAADAMRIEQNLTVTLDGERGLVYEGLC